MKNVTKEISPNWKKMIESKSTKKKQLKHYADGSTNNGKSGMEKSETKNKANNQNEIWFDGVNRELIRSTQLTPVTSLCLEKSTKELTNTIAVDCEMVGTGYLGQHSALARISVVNLYGHCVYDKFVKPIETVTDYRTAVSGITAHHMKDATDFDVVQKEISEIFDGRILVGHSIHNDLKVLFLSHPRNMIRDTAVYFRKYFHGHTPSLKRLASIFLNLTIQDGEHDSVIDAQATMRLYTLHKRQWESQLRIKINRINKRRLKRQNKNKAAKSDVS